MPTNKFSSALIIPTLNACRENWNSVLTAIKQQDFQPDILLVLDSGSTDSTNQLAEEYGFEIQRVASGTFDHAGTRKWGIGLVKERADIVIFMTQDALLADTHALRYLVRSFDDQQVAAAYGRQLPRDQATCIETFARLFNYPETAETRSSIDEERLGMKVAFCSDSFAAYRIAPVIEENAFPDGSIVGEDYITAANLLLQGYKLRDEAEACVKHSHDYTIKQEFKRYFDIGVFHQERSELIQALGSTEKAGGSFVRSELKYLLANHPQDIPLALIRTVSKYLGYKLGKANNLLNNKIKRKFSMHAFYFSD